MKKNARKLELRRDTIRSLGAIDLDLAHGGRIKLPTLTCGETVSVRCSDGIVCATTITTVCPEH